MPGLRTVLRRSVRSPALGRVWTGLAPVVGAVGGRIWRPTPGRVVLVPPAASGSLGDDALMSVFRAAVEPGTDLEVVDVSRAGTGRGSVRAALHALPPRGWIALLRARPERVVVVGADVMNGHYSDWLSARRWDLLSCAGAAGVDAVAAGFSWPGPEGCRPQSVRAARAAHRARTSCRDPASVRRFAEATGREPLGGADAAFLLAPDPHGDGVAAVHDWAAARRAAGQNPIALNLNGLTLGRVDDEPGRLAAVVDAVVALADDGIAVVLVPHDDRAAAGDVAWAAATDAALDGRAPDTLVVEPTSGAEAKAMVGAVDAAVSGRMHLAIACLGSGVPVSLLDYQGKVEGLDTLFAGAEVRTAVPVDDWCRDLAGIARRLVATAPDRAAAIARSLDHVRAEAQKLVDDAVSGGR